MSKTIEVPKGKQVTFLGKQCDCCKHLHNIENKVPFTKIVLSTTKNYLVNGDTYCFLELCVNCYSNFEEYLKTGKLVEEWLFLWELFKIKKSEQSSDFFFIKNFYIFYNASLFSEGVAVAARGFSPYWFFHSVPLKKPQITNR